MTDDQLSAATRTVVDAAEHLEQLKLRAAEIFGPEAVAARGYITPSEELQVRQLQISYWQTRNALFELVNEIRREAEGPGRASPEEFLAALAAAALLVDTARFLRETFHGVPVVRRKLDEPDPIYGIPPRMYDDVQRSLVSTHHAWYLWQAIRHYDARRAELCEAAAEGELAELVAIIDRLQHRLRPSVGTYLRTLVRVRGRRMVRRVGRDALGRAVYEMQQAVSCRLSEMTVRPGHTPGLPVEVRAAVVALLRPGDVLVVRKEFAATNYFLPGYWPHAALYVGTLNDVRSLGIAGHEHVCPRAAKLANPLPAMFGAAGGGNEMGDVANGAPRCVLESLKDGVRVRSVDSPLASDSIVVIRPLVGREDIASALARAFMHEGKPYDFDFDFCSSHKLVCTEVVYRAYDGVADVRFELQRHVGRFALAAGDLLRMALARRHFEVLAVYSRGHANEMQTGASAEQIIRQVEGAR